MINCTSSDVSAVHFRIIHFLILKTQYTGKQKIHFYPKEQLNLSLLYFIFIVLLYSL